MLAAGCASATLIYGNGKTLFFPVSIHLDINSFRDVHVIHGGNTLSESTEQNILSRLTALEQKMSNLDNTSNALIDELESLQAVSRELKIESFVDKLNEYLEDVVNIKEDLSCKISDEIENEQMKRMIETRIKTIPDDIENLKNEYSDLRGKLAELRDEISKNKK